MLKLSDEKRFSEVLHLYTTCGWIKNSKILHGVCELKLYVLNVDEFKMRFY